MLRIIGDSHAQACFQGFPRAHIEAINSRTAWRIARDGVELDNRVWTPPSADDTTCWCFGEIDMRCHIVRIAERDGRFSDVLAYELASLYVRRIAGFAGKHIVCSVVPPSDLANSPNYPIHGSLKERVCATNWFNGSCSRLAGIMRMGYCDFHDAYALPDGSLNQSLSDGNVHVAVEHNGACRDALARVLAALA